jgi:hypothetical protein
MFNGELSKMLTKLTLSAAAFAALAFATPISAATLGPPTPVPAVEEGLLHQAQWYGHRRCRYWRRECASRWGWGSRGYYRCLWRHGCDRRW